jgi:hypothetical protein
MTSPGKTFKEQKDEKELHERWKMQREGKKEEKLKGGHRNLVREALEESQPVEEDDDQA